MRPTLRSPTITIVIVVLIFFFLFYNFLKYMLILIWYHVYGKFFCHFFMVSRSCYHIGIDIGSMLLRSIKLKWLIDSIIKSKTTHFLLVFQIGLSSVFVSIWNWYLGYSHNLLSNSFIRKFSDDFILTPNITYFFIIKSLLWLLVFHHLNYPFNYFLKNNKIKLMNIRDHFVCETHFWFILIFNLKLQWN